MIYLLDTDLLMGEFDMHSRPAAKPSARWTC
jgi:hypothetical protein